MQDVIEVWLRLTIAEMAYACIIEGCKNIRTNVRKSNEYISFFRLPQSSVMREGCLKKIGKVKMPANSENGEYQLSV